MGGEREEGNTAGSRWCDVRRGLPTVELGRSLTPPAVVLWILALGKDNRDSNKICLSLSAHLHQALLVHGLNEFSRQIHS